MSETQKASQATTTAPALAELPALNDLIDRATALYERAGAMDASAAPNDLDQAWDEAGEFAGELDIAVRAVLLPIVERLLDGLASNDPDTVLDSMRTLHGLPVCVRRQFVAALRPCSDPDCPEGHAQVFGVGDRENFTFLHIDRVAAVLSKEGIL